MSLTIIEQSTGSDGLGRRHIALSGALDLAAVPMTRDRIGRMLAVPGVTELVLDLAAVDFLDAAGVGALVVGHHEAVRAGKALWVTSARGLTRRVLDLTGVAVLLSGSAESRRQG